NDLDRDANGIGVATHVREALERAAKRRRALVPVSRLEPPLDELGRDDALPSEAIAEIDVRRTDRHVALIRELGQRGERFVAAIELLGENVGELLRHRARLLLVGLDLDPLREELGDA